MVMPYGKYKGLPLTEIPDDYLEWALSEMSSLSDGDRDAITLHLYGIDPEMFDDTKPFVKHGTGAYAAKTKEGATTLKGDDGNWYDLSIPSQKAAYAETFVKKPVALNSLLSKEGIESLNELVNTPNDATELARQLKDAKAKIISLQNQADSEKRNNKRFLEEIKSLNYQLDNANRRADSFQVENRRLTGDIANLRMDRFIGSRPGQGKHSIVTAELVSMLITAGYKALTLKHHPDKNPTDLGANSRMQVINEVKQWIDENADALIGGLPKK
jgi:hypothetical protein